jgi:hypothetical protein
VRVYAAAGEVVWTIKSFLHRITDADILHLITDEEIDEAARHLPDPAACTDEARAIVTNSSIGRAYIVLRRFPHHSDGKYCWLPMHAEGAGRGLG